MHSALSFFVRAAQVSIYTYRLMLDILRVRTHATQKYDEWQRIGDDVNEK